MNDYRTYTIYHHGIKGMHWGIRRYQNKDGSLTLAGKNRYSISEAKNKKAEYEKRNTLLRYKKLGLSEEEAEAAYEKKQKAKKIFAALGIASIVGAGAYYTYRTQGRKFLDYTIRKGSNIQTVTSDTNLLKDGNRFYFSKGKRDRDKYRALFSKNMKANQNPMFASGASDSYKKEAVLKARHNIKVASEKNAEKNFIKMLSKDKKVRGSFVNDLKNKGLSETMQEIWAPEYYRKTIPAVDKFVNNNGDVNKLSNDEKKDLYRYFNYNFVNHNKYESVQKQFMNNMAKKGYGAVVDSNDAVQGGFNTKSAAIMFNSKNIKMAEVRQLNSDTEKKAATNTLLYWLGDASIYSLPAITGLSYSKYFKDYDKKVVKNRENNG